MSPHETDDTRGLSQRDLIVEMRADLKKLTDANIVKRVEDVEDNQRWFGRALILQFIGIVGAGAVIAMQVGQ